MSIEALNWAFGLTLETTLKFTLVALANRADEEGICYPGVRWIMGKTCMGERTVRAHLKELAARGLMVKIAQQRDDGGQSTNEYQLALRQPGLVLAPPGANLAPPPAKLAPGGATAAGGAVQSSQGGGADAAPAPLSSNTKVETKKKAPQKARRTLPDNFSITPEVRAWAEPHGYTTYLQLHFDYFIDYAKSTGRMASDWDATFRNAIRADWGGVRKAAIAAGVRPAKTVEQRTCTEEVAGERCGMPAKDRGAHGDLCDGHWSKRIEKRPMPENVRAELDKFRTGRRA